MPLPPVIGYFSRNTGAGERGGQRTSRGESQRQRARQTRPELAWCKPVPGLPHT